MDRANATHEAKQGGQQATGAQNGINQYCEISPIKRILHKAGVNVIIIASQSHWRSKGNKSSAGNSAAAEPTFVNYWFLFRCKLQRLSVRELR